MQTLRKEVPVFKRSGTRRCFLESDPGRMSKLRAGRQYGGAK